MYTKKIVIFMILLFSATAAVVSEEIVLGGSDSWDRMLRMETSIGGTAGSSFLQLADSEYQPTEETEMLFNFNRQIYDAAGKYSIKRNTGVSVSSIESQKGRGSAAFTGEGTFLELIPDGNAAFAAGSGRLNNFSIEFWMSPARLSEGETIIQWVGALEAEGKEPLQQEIICAISGRGLFWEFNNLFLSPDLGPTSFMLKSSKSLIPKRWHHHMIRYDSSTGLLEYLIDGTPEDMTYTSRDGNEEQEIFYPFIGAAKAATFVIGCGFTGFLDEFRISTALMMPELNKFNMNSGSAVSGTIDLGYYDSRFLGIKADSRIEGKTQIYYYYRISNNYFQTDAEYPGWNQINADEMLPPGIKGRYIQIMAGLLPDGTGTNTPRLNRLSLLYTGNLPPLPPAYVSGKAENGRVIIRWQKVTESDIAGYKIYYGDRPGMYFGTDAAAGSSPVDVGNVLSAEIDGLTNGKLYYFAVTSYDNAEIPHESVFSREISIRPSAIIRNEE